MLMAISAQAQEPIRISSEIVSATVYPRGAQIQREGGKFLAKGRQFIIFDGLASELNPATVSVTAEGGVNVLSVSSKVNYLKPGAKPVFVKNLEDSLKSYEFDHKFNQNMLSVYAEEKAMVLANKSVGWNGQGRDFLIEDLEDLSDFYRDRLADIMLKIMELEVKQQGLSKNIQRLRAQLNEQNAKLNRSTGEVMVEVLIPANMNAKFSLTYMVQSAGWMPSYNVNVTEVDQPLQFSYNAKVYQNTGIDWEDVKLTLTNANPNLSGDKPVIHPWRLYFINEMYELDNYSNRATPMPASSEVGVYGNAKSLSMDEAATTIDYPVNDAVTQFQIKTGHNIPSNGKHQGISIDAFTIPASYQYYVAPKFDPAAFLIARVADFEQYDLLPGEANLFFTNTYVGKVYINPNTITDTFDLSLGRDQSIIVKRERVKDFSETKKIGNNTKETLGLKISIRNTKSTKVQLVVEDQIPISSDKEIEVTLVEGDNAKHNQNTGLLRWSKVILGGNTESISFRYAVKYPSDRKINL